jgi:transcriptional regulator of arginine metabolism
MRGLERRREVILSVIAEEPVVTQEELVAALRRRGVRASQASVSRDIAALKLVKVDGHWARPAVAVSGGNPLEARVRELLLSVTPVGENLIVLKTPPGEASALGFAVDHLELAGVAGSLAGDDTVFVAAPNRRASAAVARRLRALMAGIA